MRSGILTTIRFLLIASILATSGFARGADSIERQSERGPVRVDLAITPAEPVIGDVIELRLEVHAEYGVEVLMPEFGEALGRFEIVDFAPSQQQDETGGSIARQVYRLQPAHSGTQTIPPLRVEFVDRRVGGSPAPEGEDAYEVLTERVSLEIAPILAEDAPLSLRPVHSDLGSVASGSRQRLRGRGGSGRSRCCWSWVGRRPLPGAHSLLRVNDNVGRARTTWPVRHSICCFREDDRLQQRWIGSMSSYRSS